MELLRSISQVLCVIVRGPRFILWGDCLQPDSNLTTSAWVGQASMDGFVWARIAEAFIDRLFVAGHCRAAALRKE